jgi:hypothetical protein
VSCGATLNEEKFKHTGLAQQNGFGPAFLLRMLRLEQSLTPAVDWLDCLIYPGGLLLVVSHLLQSQFQFYGWGWEKVNN